MDLLPSIILAFWFILPAYAANGLAVVFGRGNRLNKPLDFGHNFIDKKRVFGDGKTVRGLIGGTAFGTLIGALQLISGQQIALPWISSNAPIVYWFYLASTLGASQAILDFIIYQWLTSGSLFFILMNLPTNSKAILAPTIFHGFLLSFGALIGDLIGSFIKRRLNLERGRPAPPLDQLDFIIGALLFSFIDFIPPIEIIIVLVVLTPIIHLAANIIGYKLRLKKEPW
ncbi:MAG: CDP-2,3-bis-(O-geranylgeranyl)-sn-glycerol synthase [Candidatus Freyarchaeum deiterrae]